MMPRTLLTALAMIVALAYLGPALEDHSGDFDVAADLEDARLQAARQALHESRLQRLCGPNAAWLELADGEIQCKTKRGTPTQRVQLTAKATP